MKKFILFAALFATNAFGVGRITNSDLTGSAGITNANLAAMATLTIKGNSTGGSATPSDLSVATVTGMLNTFTASLKGLVPPPGGSPTGLNCLKDDGTWGACNSGITQLTGDVTAGPGSGSQAATIANLAVTNAKIANGTIDLTTKVTGVLPSANVGANRTVNAQTGTTYTFVLGDGSSAGGFPLVTFANASPVTVTVPTNASVAFPVGSQIDFSVDAAGPVTISPAGGVTVDSSSGSFVIPQNSAGTLVKKATNTWSLYIGSSGSGSAITSLTGDVTASGPGAAATTIANLAVTNAKIANSTIDLTTKVTGVLPNANTTASSSNTGSAIVARDGSGNFSAGTMTGSVNGNASTASALAANPTDCSAGQKATAIDAAGNLTCSAVSLTADVSGVLPSANVGGGRTINAQTGTTYTFVLGDGSAAGGLPLVTGSNASAQTFTVPPQSSVAWPTGTQIDVCQLGAGKLTLAQGSGVTISSKSSNKSIGAQNVCVTLVRIASDSWLLTGDLIP